MQTRSIQIWNMNQQQRKVLFYFLFFGSSVSSVYERYNQFPRNIQVFQSLDFIFLGQFLSFWNVKIEVIRK